MLLGRERLPGRVLDAGCAVAAAAAAIAAAAAATTTTFDAAATIATTAMRKLVRRPLIDMGAKVQLASNMRWLSSVRGATSFAVAVATLAAVIRGRYRAQSARRSAQRHRWQHHAHPDVERGLPDDLHNKQHVREVTGSVVPRLHP